MSSIRINNNWNYQNLLIIAEPSSYRLYSSSSSRTDLWVCSPGFVVGCCDFWFQESSLLLFSVPFIFLSMYNPLYLNIKYVICVNWNTVNKIVGVGNDINLLTVWKMLSVSVKSGLPWTFPHLCRFFFPQSPSFSNVHLITIITTHFINKNTWLGASRRFFKLHNVLLNFSDG